MIETHMKKSEIRSLVYQLILEDVNNLVGMSTAEVLGILDSEHNYHFVSSDVWVYKLQNRPFWTKKYILMTFERDHVIKCKFTRSLSGLL